MGKIFQNPFFVLKNKRDIKFDLLKLWALLSVVLDHSLQRWIENAQNTQLYNFIFLSQMPIFMFVAGFFAFKQVKKMDNLSPRKNTVNLFFKIAGLLIPFFSYVVIKSLITKNYTDIYLCFLFPQKSLWFLWSLMWMEIIMFFSQIISKKMAKNNIILLLINLSFYLSFLIPFIVLLVLNPSLFDSKLICYYSLFFIFGYIISFLFDNFCFIEKPIFNLIVLFVSLTLLVIIMILKPTVIFDNETFLNLFLRIIGSASAVCLAYSICFFLSKIFIFDIV